MNAVPWCCCSTIVWHCDCCVTTALLQHCITASAATNDYGFILYQWRSQRGSFGGSNFPIHIEVVFFTAVKLLLLNIITSL